MPSRDELFLKFLFWILLPETVSGTDSVFPPVTFPSSLSVAPFRETMAIKRERLRAAREARKR